MSRDKTRVRNSIRTLRFHQDEMTQQELAERIGSRREVVSRAIAALEKDGLFEKTRGALVLRDAGELNRRIAQKGLSVKLD